mmetsp:Transcript_78201/g.211550  ORF Transcript_78201/g.211550 Transcript_78201/m.211550 type:complete len:188 (+) Transcript_78201:97-660(+)
MGMCCSGEADVLPDLPTQKDVLENLPVAERKLWRLAFASLDSTRAGKLQTDHALLRVFLSEGTALRSESEVESALARWAPDGNLDLEAFNQLMQASVQDDTTALMLFQQMCGDMDTVNCADARTQLRVLGQSRLNIGGDWDEVLWDKVLDVALNDVEFELDMESWVARCGMFTRYMLALNQQKNPIP